MRAFTSMPWEKSNPTARYPRRVELAAEVAGAAREIDTSDRPGSRSSRPRGGAIRRPSRTSSPGSPGRSEARSCRTARGRLDACPRPAGAPTLMRAPRLRPVGSSMWSSAVSSSTRRKWWETRVVTAGSSSPNASTSLLSRDGVVTRRVADRLADVFVEQLDGTFGEPSHRCDRHRERAPAGRRAAARTPRGAAPSAPARCRRRCSAPRRRPVRPSRMPSRSTAWISDAGTPLRALNVSRSSVSVAGSPLSVRAAATAAARSASATSSSPLSTRRIAARVSPLPWSDRIWAMRSTCSGPYQATRPSRSGGGSRPRDW